MKTIYPLLASLFVFFPNAGQAGLPTTMSPGPLYASRTFYGIT